jgi:hypothetical protein
MHTMRADASASNLFRCAEQRCHYHSTGRPPCSNDLPPEAGPPDHEVSSSPAVCTYTCPPPAALTRHAHSTLRCARSIAHRPAPGPRRSREHATAGQRFLVAPHAAHKHHMHASSWWFVAIQDHHSSQGFKTLPAPGRAATWVRVLY